MIADSLSVKKKFDDLEKALGIDVYAVFLRSGLEINRVDEYLIVKDVKAQSGSLLTSVCLVHKGIAEDIAGPEYEEMFKENPYVFFHKEIEDSDRVKFHKINCVIPIYIADKKKAIMTSFTEAELNKVFCEYRSDPHGSSEFEGRIPDNEPDEEKPLKFPY